MLQINTNNLNTRKKVEIDGHLYTVRRYGAGEQLELNRLLRQAEKLSKKLESGKGTAEEEVKAETLSSRMIDLFAGLFDDGGDGTKARQLVSSLSQTEIKLMFEQIFEEKDDGSADTTDKET